jgi:hypothetical protein
MHAESKYVTAEDKFGQMNIMNWIDKSDVNVAFVCIVQRRFKFVLPDISWWLILICMVDAGSRYLKSGVELVGIRPAGHF